MPRRKTITEEEKLQKRREDVKINVRNLRLRGLLRLFDEERRKKLTEYVATIQKEEVPVLITRLRNILKVERMMPMISIDISPLVAHEKV